MGGILKIAKVTLEKCMAFYSLIQHTTESLWLVLQNVSVSRIFNASGAQYGGRSRALLVYLVQLVLIDYPFGAPSEDKLCDVIMNFLYQSTQKELNFIM